MKTPREILFERHRAAEPKLDAVRKEVLAEKFRRPEHREAGAMTLAEIVRGFIREYRRHLTAMAAIWFLVALLDLSTGRSANLAAAVPKAKIPSPQIILMSLRENRRELLEMIQPSGARDAGSRKLIVPQPRSQRCYENAAT